MSEDARTPQGAAPEKADWPVWAEAVLTRMRQSPNLSRAAEAAQVDRRTVQRLAGRDADFDRALHEAREVALDLLEEAIFAQATSGLPATKTTTTTKRDAEGKLVEETVSEVEELHRNPTLAMFFLKRWRPEYRESFRIEQTGVGGGPIEVNVTAETAKANFYAALDELRPQVAPLALPPAPPDDA